MSAAVRLLVGVGLLLSGCTIAVEDDDGPLFDYPGTLVVDWTVAESHDARECERLGVDRVWVVVETPSGRPIDSFSRLCEAFEMEIDLDPGWYRASAAALGRAGERLSTYVDLGSFDLYEGDVVAIPINFPEDSFR